MPVESLHICELLIPLHRQDESSNFGPIFGRDCGNHQGKEGHTATRVSDLRASSSSFIQQDRLGNQAILPS